jgi:hypothetical protein
VRRTSLIERLPLALLAALLMGGAVAFFFIAMPIALIERAVIASGLPLTLAAATPPLGGTARALVAGAAAMACGGVTWIGMTWASRHPGKGLKRSTPKRGELDAEPAARRPIFASSDLGSPEEPLTLTQEGVAVLPEELPAAEWVEIEFDAGDVLELVDVLEEESAPPPPASALPSITSLMARLEAGATRRAAKATLRPQPRAPATAETDSALRNALSELQRLAIR